MTMFSEANYDNAALSKLWQCWVCQIMTMLSLADYDNVELSKLWQCWV